LPKEVSLENEGSKQDVRVLIEAYREQAGISFAKTKAQGNFQDKQLRTINDQCDASVLKLWADFLNGTAIWAQCMNSY